jgi:hypothetical protein
MATPDRGKRLCSAWPVHFFSLLSIADYDDRQLKTEEYILLFLHTASKQVAAHTVSHKL